MTFDPENFDDIVTNIKDMQVQGRGPEMLRRLNKEYTKLDNFYWEAVREILTESIRPDVHKFIINRQDKAIINSCLLSVEIIPGADEEFKNEVFDQVLLPTAAPVYYLTDWLERRIQDHILLDYRPKLEEELESAHLDKVFQQKEIVSLRGKRNEFYKILAKLFAHLPGMSEQASEIIINGKLDEQIDLLIVEQFIDPGQQEKQARMKQLVELRKKFMAQAAMRADKRLLPGFEGLAKLHFRMGNSLKQAADKIKDLKKEESSGQIEELEYQEKIRFLASTLGVVRNLLRLGSTDAGLRRVHNVMHNTDARVDTGHVQGIMDLISEYDPYLPGQPDIVIAPYRGNGFYEWDHNVIFVPLIGTRPINDTIVHGLANYRLMEDALSERYKIINPYKERYGAHSFRKMFMQDYNNWILTVGMGLRGAMDDETFQFFKNNIGPNPEIGLFPGEIMSLSRDEINEEVKELRKALAKNPDLPVDRERLVALFWFSGRVQLAYDNMRILFESMKENGKIALAYGLLCFRLGIKEEAVRALKRCVENAPQSLWQVYANELLGQV
ncbi:tetratricopeptide repeat protein [Planctomycetota bacterium]